MAKFHRLFASKVLAVILSFLLLNGPALGDRPESEVLKGAKVDFDAALKEYQNGLYKQASAKLETVLNLIEEDDPQFTAQVNLLLGACYEKLGNRDKARGLEQNRYPWGNNKPTCYYANFLSCGNSTDQPGNLLPVYFNSAGMSSYSVYNMAGNVSEWCRDWYSSSYYFVSPGKNPQGPGNGSFRVVRGGDITSRAFDLRSANRDSKPPTIKAKNLDSA